MAIAKAVAVAALSVLLMAASWAPEPGKVPSPAPPAAPAAALSKTTLPARGSQQALLTISRFGRYSVTVKSAQGVSLQLVDRMAGPGEVAGKPGEQDGRLDLFLDRGECKILARADRKGTGTMALAVHEFTEVNGPKAPQLVELKPVEEALDDFEQRSYWIEIAERMPVAIEAAGRNFADLRLWKDGSWLEEAEPYAETVQPKTGQPLAVRRLMTTLEPGLYLLSAYGGPSLPWAEGSPDHPFHLRLGIPKLAEAGRRRFTVGPLGIDRYLVPGKATYARLELPEAAPAELGETPLDPANPFGPPTQRAAVTKKSLPPIAELSMSSLPDQFHVLTVQAPAGQPYVLEQFEARQRYVFSKSGEYWISTINSGDPADSVGATAILVRAWTLTTRHEEPVAEEVLRLDAKTAWTRRCNLLAPLTVYVRIAEAGSYEVVGTGVEAKYRFEPFFTTPPKDYKTPDARPSGSKWNLEAGLYVFSAVPEKKGIVELTLRPVTAPGAAQLTPAAGGVRAAVQLPPIQLDANSSYDLYVNEQPEVKSGIVLRELPLDLSQTLPIALSPGQTVAAPFKASEAGALRCEAEDGTPLEVSVDGAEPARAPSVAVGTHKASVRATGAKTVLASLMFEPTRLSASTPLPPIPDSALARLPDFPRLTAEATRFFDLERGQSQSFLVDARQPALYRLETTGLLATQGNLRSRTIVSLAREAANGVGRNFLIQSYLRSGDYQLSVSPQRPSEGHLGLRLSPTTISDGGSLADGVAARADLPSGQAIAYSFRVRRAGDYTLRAFGLGHAFHGRLEDADGWPVVKPNGPAEYSRRFEAGAYRLVVLPESVPGRVVTILKRKEPPLAFKGHGPHSIPLARPVGHLWMEPATGKERVPDVWQFDLPAPAQTSIELTDQMAGDLLRVGADGAAQKVAAIPPQSGWKGELTAGRYRIEAACVRTNSSLPYTVAVYPEPLVAGLSREVTAPVTIPMSVGTAGLVEVSSFGSTDVRARIFDAKGNLVAEGDDRPGDWNFLVAASLGEGLYSVRVEPVGAEKASTTVTMEAPEVVEEKPLSTPVARSVTPGRKLHMYPLVLSPGASLLAVTAKSSESLGVSLEVEESGAWRAIGTRIGRAVHIETPLAAAKEGTAPPAHRVRLWSVDRRGNAASLAATATRPAQATEAALKSGLTLAAAGQDVGVAAARVALERPGLFRLEEGPAGLRACSEPETLCAEAGDGTFAARSNALWLLHDLSGKGAFASARATRVVLEPGTARAVALAVPDRRPTICDLAPGQGGPVFITARAISGQPGVAVGSAGDAAMPDVAAMAVSTRAAAAVSLKPARASALVWSASRSSDPLDVRLSQQTFRPARPEKTDWGTLSGALSGVSVRAFALPEGPKRLRLAIGEGTVAVLSRGDEVAAVIGTGEERIEETVDGAADRLTLLRVRDGEGRFAIEVLPLAAGGAAPALTPGKPFETALERAGRVRLTVPAPPAGAPWTLHVRGAGAEPLFVASDGRVLAGRDLDVGSDAGTLVVAHEPGTLLCWLDQADRPGAGLWGDLSAPAAREMKLPSVVPLSGPAQVLRLTAAEPVMLHLRSATPAVTRWKRGDAKPDIEAHPEGCDLDVFLPGGPAEIGLRALAGGALWGTAELTATPIVPTGEGLGPEVMIPSGGTRAFSFEVKTNGPVGVGVRADSDLVTGTLWSAAGAKLGSGLVQMPQLEPGKYVLAIKVPASSPPVQARPALAGLVPPSLGPPDEVIQSYLAPPQEGGSFSAARVARPRVEPASALAPHPAGEAEIAPAENEELEESPVGEPDQEGTPQQ